MLSSASIMANTTVELDLMHNLTTIRIPQVRFDLTQTIASVKASIEKRYGTSTQFMQLVLKNKQMVSITTLSNDDLTLASYGAQNGYVIHVIDTNPNSVLQAFDDLSQVDKYVMKDEDYDKLPDNFRKWKKKLIENNPELMTSNKSPVIDPEFQQNIAVNMPVGSRCRVIETGYRGTVKYNGKIPNLGFGYFIGIQLDQPLGQNNGTYISTQYFQCPDQYGLFIRPDKIQVGDFPQLDIDEIDEI